MGSDPVRQVNRGNQATALSRAPAEDAAWVGRIRCGDQRAFEQMYQAYYRALVGFVYTYVRSEPAAEEEVQELFLAIWHHRQRWDVRTTLRAYLFKAARNRALNYLRHEGVSSTVLDDAVAEGRAIAMGESPRDVQQDIEADELAGAAQRAIARLPARCRTAFTLCRAHGLSYAETAQVMGISEHTVKVQMARALAALRAGLARWLP